MNPSWCQRFYKKTGILAAILLLGLLQEGCLAVAWVAAVGADSMRTSQITFGRFEESWVSSEQPTQIAEGLSLSSLAVLPIEGDADMGYRLTQILQQETALRVESSINLAHESIMLQDDEANRAAIAKEVSHDLVVDAVLIGHVSGQPSHPSDWGLKAEEPRRLFLYLVDRDGHLLWKDELPFTVVTGSKPPLEGAVQASLTHHLMDHVRDLGLDALGYLPHKTS